MSKYYFFYHGFLSNFYRAPFEDETGQKFHHVEQYMMFHKAKMFGDHEIANFIKLQSDPLECKKLGRRVKNFDQSAWDSRKRSIVHHGVKLKFDQNPELKQMLIDIKEEVIVEASPFDSIWGIGYDESMAIQNPKTWGANLLGLILTEIRDGYTNRSKSIF